MGERAGRGRHGGRGRSQGRSQGVGSWADSHAGVGSSRRGGALGRSQRALLRLLGGTGVCLSRGQRGGAVGGGVGCSARRPQHAAKGLGFRRGGVGSRCSIPAGEKEADERLKRNLGVAARRDARRHATAAR